MSEAPPLIQSQICCSGRLFTTAVGIGLGTARATGVPVLRARTSLGRAALVLALALWASPAAADQPLGGACTSGTADSPQSDGNNVTCVSNVWQYPAYQHGNTSASCNSTNAGIVKYSSGVFYGCDGTNWVPMNSGMQFISTQTASSSAALQWTGLSSSYNSFRLVCSKLVPSTTSVLIKVQVGEGAGPTWETGSYAVNMVSQISTESFNSTNYSGFPMANNGIGVSGGYTALDLTFYQLGASATWNSIESGYTSTTSTPAEHSGGGYYYGDTNTITALKVFYSSGNITSGTCTLYGMN
jgi:hypothetical protein